MQINDVIKWYKENVDHELNEQFLKGMIKMGIIKPDIEIDYLNLLLLERFNDKFIIENGKYKVKKNRIELIEDNGDKFRKTETTANVSRFKIEKINGNKLKLVKK